MVTITNVDNRPVYIGKIITDINAVITIPDPGGSGPDTLDAGTILARDSVSLKYVPFVVGGSTNENGIPKAVLLTSVSVDTTPNDVAAAGIVLIDGVVDSNRIITKALDTITEAIKDQLRLYGLVSQPVHSLTYFDNQ